MKTMEEDGFTLSLLLWFGENARDLPWRRSSDPYHVWLSEIMLQQTRVVAVLEYYRRFLAELPTISALADCDEEVLMKLWQGLGYYNRARNLQKAARQIMEDHGGIFPCEYEKIRSLAGIGDYTAGAIGSTVYNLPYPAVDGNVFRVMSRICGDFGDISSKEMKKRTADWVLEHMSRDFAGLFNQALMELGAVVCLPNGEPLCKKCPVSRYCACFGSELWRDLPVKPSKKPRKVEHRRVYVLKSGDLIALRQRPAKGLLGGLWEYPHCLAEEEFPVEGAEFGRGVHIFSHIEWHMTGFLAKIPLEALPEGCIWATEEELRSRYAVPSAFSFVNTFLERKKSL